MINIGKYIEMAINWLTENFLLLILLFYLFRFVLFDHFSF